MLCVTSLPSPAVGFPFVQQDKRQSITSMVEGEYIVNAWNSCDIKILTTPFAISTDICNLMYCPSLCLCADDSNIWEEDLESEHSIRYDKSGQVTGATLNKLVERITSTRDHGEGRRGGRGEGEREVHVIGRREVRGEREVRGGERGKGDERGRDGEREVRGGERGKGGERG